LINLYRENLFFANVCVCPFFHIHTHRWEGLMYIQWVYTKYMWINMWMMWTYVKKSFMKALILNWYWMTGKQQYNTLLKVEIGFKILAKNNKTCLNLYYMTVIDEWITYVYT
jgi:hypothetical protein